jgi:cytochrome c oxidase cbb3-type subunit 3
MFRVCFLVLFLLSSAAAQRIENPLGSSPEVVAAGRTVYHQNCTSCHGLDGAAGDRAPALAAKNSYTRTTDPDIFDAIRNGISGTEMPSMGLSDDDAWRIVAFLRSLRSSAADFPPAGNVAHGEQIYLGKAECSSCHMIGAHGGLVGPDLTNLGTDLTLQRITEALTVAKPHVPDGYVPVTVHTTDGKTIRGVLKNENNFSFQILGSDDRLHMLMSDEIVSMERSAVSIMPTDYGQLLSPEEMTDLVAYLSRLVRRTE